MAKRLTERTGQPFHLITRKEDLTPERLREIAPRTVFFPHWSYLIPATIHEGWECVIFHMTDLPYGRGGSPLQNLIQRGHRETMLTALRCVAELDAGPVYLKRPLCLEGSASEIFLRAASLIETMIETIIREDPEPQPQQGEPVIFQRRKPADSDLSQAPIQSLNDFFDFIRMLDAEGYPRAFLLNRRQVAAQPALGREAPPQARWPSPPHPVATRREILQRLAELRHVGIDLGVDGNVDCTQIGPA
ncbi:MAG: methionyl-tRNA formyltransferase [Halochromatium sp.]|nr:methionyl-tRNA formyltransferase [Halochromatium sp.]